ncbi:MAG TPA: hypothetical protein VMV86_03820 [Methanosarcinales archaeon]|nr:hypothetical protein [Methanosarcinales archaeon]
MKKRGAKRKSITEYRDSLDKRHGDDFTEDLDAVFRGYMTLAQVSRKNGMTKPRLSQIFKRLYGSTFRKAKRKGSIRDADGTIHSFDLKNSKQFMVSLPDHLHEKLRGYADSAGLSMAVVVRDCISELFNKDGLSQLSKLF